MKQTNIIAITAITFASICSLVACTKNPYKVDVKGYAPIYANASIQKITAESAKPYTKPGKIYLYVNTTFQIDEKTGVHVIDSKDIKAPTKIAFIPVTGITEMAIKDNILYVNSTTDLVAIDIADLKNIKEVDRIQEAFELEKLADVPPYNNTYFECVDNTKGDVVGWELKELHNPKCKTN
jgi:hypothetical protein